MVVAVPIEGVGVEVVVVDELEEPSIVSLAFSSLDIRMI